MKLIGSGAGDGVQNAAAATSIFRPIVCAENLNLENGVRPQLHSRRAERQAVLRIHDVRSVQQIAVVSVTAAGKGQICTGNSSGCGGRRGIRYSGIERDQLRVTAAVEGHPNQQGLIDETGFSAGRTFFSAPLPSVALFSASCAISCIMGKKSCNTKRASPITNSRLNDRSMRCVIYESNDFDQRQPELVLDCSRLRRANFLWPLHSPSNQKWRRGGN